MFRRSVQTTLRVVAGAALVSLALALIGPPALADTERRIRRALDWPRADLSGYDTVFVEDCKIVDPLASERKIQSLLEEAPERMARFIESSIDRELFPNVERRAPSNGEQGVILQVELTQYKPGSAAARTLLVGTGAAHLDLAVRVLDAATGEELAAFTEERNFSWGGVYGGSRGITLMEEKAAIELAAYLSLSAGLARDEVATRMRDAEVAGPPEVPHGTLYLMRPQGMVGAAARFRVGVNDTEAGSSKRNTYYVVYLPPGEHRVWMGGDKKKRYKPLGVDAGGSYYWDAMNQKLFPPKKGPKKLAQCKLVRTLDLTGQQ